METQFTAIILAYLDRELTEADFKKWYLDQKMLDQPEILREIKFIMDERYDVDKKGDPNSIYFEREIDAFEDLILSLRLNEQMLSIERAGLKTMQDKIKEDLQHMRRSTIYLYVNKIGDQKSLLITAQKLIEAEKQFNVYDAENWKDIAELLGL